MAKIDQMHEMNLDEFFTNGFTYTFDYDVIKYIREEDLRDPDSWFQSDEGLKYPLNYDLSAVMDYLQEKYVTPFFGKSEKGYNYIWSNNEKSAQEWHNDLIEGPNLFFLYYLNDVYTDGEIRFRVNGVETGNLQPRLGLLVMGSQESHVEHKAEPSTETRIVSNYAFYVST